MAEMISASVQRDIEDIGKAINTVGVITPRVGEPFKSIPMVSIEALPRITILEEEKASKAEVGAALSEKVNTDEVYLKSQTYSIDEVDQEIQAAELNLQTQIAAVGVGNKAYKTYALMDADKANIPAKSKVTVTNDTTASNNGDWQWDGVAFTKSAYDPLTQSQDYTDNELNNIGKQDLKNLTGSVGIADGSEYSLNKGLQSAETDQNYNLISFVKNGVQYFAVPVQFDAPILVNGVAIDLSQTPTIEQKQFIENAALAYETFPPDEFELNKNTKYTVIDSDLNILFDVDSYLAAIEKIKTVDVVKSNPYVPYIKKDALDNRQIHVQNVETFEEKVVTTSGDNHSPVQFQQDAVMWQSSKDATVDSGLYYAQAPNFIEHPLSPRKKIVGWGHSFMAASRFLTKLNELTGIDTYNFGVSGLRSEGIAGRHGGNRLKFKPVGGSIPSSGSVVLQTPTGERPWWLVANSATHITNGELKGSLAGISGHVKWDGTNLIFYRKTEGSSVSVTEFTEYVVENLTTGTIGNITSKTLFDQHDECINIIWLGRNSVNPTTVIPNLKKMIAFLKTKTKKVVVCPDFMATTETTGTNNWNNTRDLNAAYKAEFPEFYCEINGVDLLQNFINHANPDYSVDVDAVANGTTPPSLLLDTLHPSQTLQPNALHIGADVNAQFVYQFLLMKGWI